MPAEERGRLDNGQCLTPGEAPGQQNQREPHRVWSPPRRYLPLPIQRQLLPQEQLLGREGGPRPETARQEPHEIHPERGTHAVKVNDRRDSSHDGSDFPPSDLNSPQYLRF